MLNDDMDQVVLVKGWKKSANWSFPRGKIDQNELDLTCAVREVYEETGYDLREAGLVRKEEDTKSINVQIRGQDLMMYVFRGVPMDTDFMPRTRKEISKVQWHKLSELPTVKSKKQQHEGHGDGLAGNANKYYMVAPFLGPLKKWISQQRRNAKSLSASNAKIVAPVNAEAEYLVSDQEQIDDRTKEKAQNDHLTRLLQTLRQSSQAISSDLPEVSEKQHGPESVVRSRGDQSAKLKALLFSGKANNNIVSQTPLNQIVGELSVPRSPRHAHAHNVNDLGAPSSFPNSTQPLQNRFALSALPLGDITDSTREPQLRPIPPPANPAKLAPRQNKDHTSASIKNKMFPQLQVLEAEMPPNVGSGQKQSPFAAPAPGIIPAPSLDTQRSALLNLFKAPKSILEREPYAMVTGIPAALELASESVPSTSTHLFELPLAVSASIAVDNNAPPSIAATYGPSQVSSPKPPSNKIPTTTPSIFVPSQVSRRSSENAPVAPRRPTAQQTKLLDMFKAPTTKPEAEKLEPPETAIELSASPRGHRSRNPSGTMPANVAARPPSKGATLGQIKIQKRPQQDEEPVSATVFGPLNSPQFDMMRTPSQEKREPTITEQSKKLSPIRILSRPTSSHALPNTAPHHVHAPKNKPKSSHTKLQQPSTPDLKAKDVTPKPFQPTILRRPGTGQDISVPSPMEPLPSPQHKQVKSQGSPTPAADHKKSLLSLFTKPSNPSPIISPPSIGPMNQGGESSAIVSPIEKPISSPVANSNSFLSNRFHPASIAAAFNAPPAKTQVPVQETEKPRKQFYAPDRMPLQSAEKTQAAKVDVNLNSDGGRNMSNASQTSTMTPANQQYLLGFLNALK